MSTIPSSDPALLAAQAKAGTAGVDAYQAAITQLQQQRQSAVDQAMKEAALRGAPGNAVSSIQSTVTAPYDAYLANLQSGQAAFQADQAARASRMADYNNAVVGARDLIGAQTQQAVAPINAKSAADVANIEGESRAKVADLQGQAQLALIQLQAKQQAAAAQAAAAAGKGNQLTQSALTNAIQDTISQSPDYQSMVTAANPATGTSAAQWSQILAANTLPSRRAADMAAAQQRVQQVFGTPSAAPKKPNGGGDVSVISQTPAPRPTSGGGDVMVTGQYPSPQVAATGSTEQQRTDAIKNLILTGVKGILPGFMGGYMPQVKPGTPARPKYTTEEAQAALQNPDYYAPIVSAVMNTLGQSGYTATPAALQVGRQEAVQNLITQAAANIGKQTAANKKDIAAAIKSQTAQDKADVAAAFAQAYGGLSLTKVAGTAKMQPEDVATYMLDPSNATLAQQYYTAFVNAINNGEVGTTEKEVTKWLDQNVADINIRNILKAMSLQ